MDIREIQNLIKFVAKSGVNEVEIEQKDFKLTIQPAKMAIKLDGVMDEAAWNTVPAVSDFKKKFPNDIGAAKKQTEVKFLYDDKNLYFGFKVFIKYLSFIFISS